MNSPFHPQLGLGALFALSLLGPALGDDFVRPTEGECVGPVTTAVVTHRGAQPTLELNGLDVTGAFTPCPGTSSSGVYLGNPPATHSPKRGGYFLRLSRAVPGGPFFAIQGAAEISSTPSGDLRLTATLVSTRDTSKTFAAQVLLRPSSAPTRVLRELYRWNYAPWGPVRPNNWDFFEVVPAGSTLTGTGGLAGFDLTLYPHPAQGGTRFRIQRGVGANGRNLTQGLGGKLAFGGACYGSARLIVDELRESTVGNPTATHSPKPGGYFLDVGASVPGGPRFKISGASKVAPQVNGELVLTADLASVSDPSKTFAAQITLRPSKRPYWVLRELFWFLYAPWGPIKPHTWSFYEIVPAGSALTGTGALSGTNLTLLPHPAGHGRRFRIQRGIGANGRNLGFGLGGKLAFNGDYSGTARLIADEFQVACLEASLATLPGIQEGPNTITLDVGGQQAAIRNFLYDSVAPTTSVTISSDQDPLELRIDYADSGCASVDLASLQIFLDGVDVTSSFSLSPTSAVASLPRPPPGAHLLEVRLGDSLGNVGVTTTPFDLDPIGSAVALELRLSPGSGALAVAGSTYDLVIRAVTATGGTAPDFVGTVLIATDQGQAPLHGAVATFAPENQGLVTLSSVGFFPTTGTVWISAGGGTPAVSGQLVVTAVPGDPVVFPALPSATQSATQVVSGVSFPGQLVQILVDGVVVASTIAGPDGSYSVSITLAEGEHEVVVQGFDAQGPGFVTSLAQTVTVDTQVTAPTVVAPVANEVVPNLAAIRGVGEPGALIEVFEGGNLLGGGVADGFGRFAATITFPASGPHAVVIRQTDPAGNVSAPTAPLNVISGQAPVVLQVFDAGSDRPGPLVNVPVEIGGSQSTTTDAFGRAVILDPPTGLQVLAIDARPSHVRLELPVTPSVGEVVRVERALLYRVPSGVASVVSLSSGVVQQSTTVSPPSDPNAALILTAGTVIGGAGTDFPELAIFPVDPSFSPAALPEGLAPSRLYELYPSGLTFSPGITVRFPNHAQLSPGTQRQIYGYKASLGGWSALGTATVDATASFLETDAPFVTGFSLYGFDDGNAISTEARLRVNDFAGDPLVGLSVSLNGLLLNDNGDGSYTRTLGSVSAGQPLRVSFSVRLPGQPLTEPGVQVTLPPTLPDPQVTDFGTFELSGLIQGDCVVAAAGGGVRTPTGAAGVTELTHATIGTVTSSGNVGVLPKGVYAGLLHKAFPESRINDPTSESGVFFEASGLPPGTALSPNTNRYLPFRIELFDFDEDSDGQVTLRYDLDQSGSWTNATIAPGFGDPASGRLGNLGGVEHLLVWDSRDPTTGVGVLGGSREVRFEITVANNGGADTSVLVTGSFWITDPPFHLVNSDPEEGQTGVIQNKHPRLLFDAPVDATTLAANVLLNGGALPIASISSFSAAHGIEIRPASPFTPGSVTIDLLGGLRSTSGGALTPTTVNFDVGSTPGEGDSDGDGLLDKEEALYGTLPGMIDSDLDGLDDFEEIFVHGTNPRSNDSDGDGLLDMVDPEPLIPLGGGGPTAPPSEPDVPFRPVASTPDSDDAPALTPIVITFSHSVDLSTIVTTGPNQNVFLQLETSPGVLTPVALSATTRLVTHNSVEVQPAAALLAGTYFVQIDAPAGGAPNATIIRTLDGEPLSPLFGIFPSTVGLLRVTPPSGLDAFETRHFMEPLAMTQWERFPLAAPTAGGRAGFAMAVPTTGRLLLVETDVAVPGRMTGTSITRTYRNNDQAASGIFGNNWHCSYDMEFRVVADSPMDPDSVPELEHRSEDGRLFTYLRHDIADVTTTTSPPGYYDTLHRVTLGGQPHLKVRDVFGRSAYYAFHVPGSSTFEDINALPAAAIGRLVEIRDRNGNAVKVHRFLSGPQEGLIDRLEDDRGRITKFHYGSGTEETLVVRVEQTWGGSSRDWLYAYNGDGSLIEVQTPPSDWSDEGVPQTNVRKKRTYGYSQLAPGQPFNLTSLTDGRGNTSFRVLYDDSNSVLQIDYGSGPDAGTATYSFSKIPAFSTLSSTQVDRNGSVLRIFSSPGGPCVGHLPETAIVSTQGFHDPVNGASQDFFTSFRYEEDGRIIEIDQSENLSTCIVRDDDCDCPIQVIQKAFPPAPLQDLVTTIGHEGTFHRTTFVQPPRANSPDHVDGGGFAISQTENPLTGQIREYSGVDQQARERLTTRYYYDHEVIVDRLATEGVTFNAMLPPSFGRDSGGQFNDPVPGVFPFDDSDNDGFPDRGGNVVAIRGPAPEVLSAADTTQFLATGQEIVTCHAYNQYGQQYLTIEPDGDLNYVQFHQAPPDLHYVQRVVSGSTLTGSDFNVMSGEVLAGPIESPDAIVAEITDYDAYGNVLATKSPRGFVSTRSVNLLNLTTSMTSAGPFFYGSQITHDGNNNPVETRTENHEPDDTNFNGIQDPGEQVTGADPEFVNRVVYNTANMPIRVEVDASRGATPHLLVTEMTYDTQQLLVGVREPEGNVHLTRYDERDLPYETVRGASDPGTQTTTRLYRDRAGRVVQVIDDDGNLDPQVTYTYDVFNRVTRVTNEGGHRIEIGYDADSNVVERIFRENAPGPGILSRTVTAYDFAGRPYLSSSEYFGTRDSFGSRQWTKLSELPGSPSRLPVPITSYAGVSLSPTADPVDGEMVNTLVFYDEEGKPKRIRDDNEHDVLFQYDVADRKVLTTDHLGSSVATVFDRSSNVIRTITTEMTASGAPAGVFYRENFFDELDRLIATVSNEGNTSRFMYDSRSNLVSTTDAQGAVSGQTLSLLPDVAESVPGGRRDHTTFPQGDLAVNEAGNRVFAVYDGASRLLERTQVLTNTGMGGGLPTGAITTQQVWDDNSRLVGRIDPKGNVTSYAYDHQNRRIREVFADGTDCRYAYDVVGTLASKVDPRGVCEEYTYDSLERLTATTVSNLPAGDQQTASYLYVYDGLNRPRRQESTYTNGDKTSCSSSYDSFSRVTREVQSFAMDFVDHVGVLRSKTPAEITGTVTRAFDGVGNKILQGYPSSRVVHRSYDAVNRLKDVRNGVNGPQLATFEHAGMGSRRLERSYPTPQITCSITYDPSRRVVSMDDIRGGVERVSGFRYAWDRVSNRRFEREITDSAPSGTSGTGNHYRYDSAYRLVQEDVGVSEAVLNTLVNNQAENISIATPAPGAGTPNTWALDVSGNRLQSETNSVVSSYLQEVGFPLADSELNQYTAVTVGATTRVREHDEAGNVLREDTGGTLTRRFDHRNRLVQWTDGGKDVRYRYDAMNRRVSKADVDTAGGADLPPRFYFYDGWQVLEEHEPTSDFTAGPNGNALLSEYVYGEGIDEVVFASVPDPSDPDSPSWQNGQLRTDLFYCHNSLGSVTAVTDSGGNVVERYAYEAYGKTTVLNPDRTVKSSQVPVQPYGFTGRRMDYEEGSGLYYYRHRYYDPEAGRFVSRDPLGMWGDPSQRGNAQSYCGNNPVNRVDPKGLDEIIPTPRNTSSGERRHVEPPLERDNLRRNGSTPEPTNDLLLRGYSEAIRVGLPTAGFRDAIGGLISGEMAGIGLESDHRGGSYSPLRGIELSEEYRTPLQNGASLGASDGSGPLPVLYNEVFHALFDRVLYKSKRGAWAKKILEEEAADLWKSDDSLVMANEAMSSVWTNLVKSLLSQIPKVKGGSKKGIKLRYVIHSAAPGYCGPGERWEEEQAVASTQMSPRLFVLSTYLLFFGSEPPPGLKAGASSDETEAAMRKRIGGIPGLDFR